MLLHGWMFPYRCCQEACSLFIQSCFLRQISDFDIFQRCQPCGPGKYVLHSLDPTAACQPCPIGAVCDGDRLHPVVSNSSWGVDTLTGWCVLSFCPAGYELINTAVAGGPFVYALQQCSPCPASRFCVGGASPSQPCPAGTYSPPGSNASSTCKPAAFLSLTLQLPLSLSTFDMTRRAALCAAVAYTLGTPLSSVIIGSTAVATRRQSGTIAQLKVTADVAVSTISEASGLVSGLREDVLNLRLTEQGLPPGKLISAIAVSANVVSVASPWPVVGGAIAGAFLLTAVTVAVMWQMFKRSETDEERLLKQTVEGLRARLGIKLGDGFLLSNEQIGRMGAKKARQVLGYWPWERKQAQVIEPVVIQLGYMEAAARLALLQDFDVHQLDAFCLCLEYGCVSRPFNTISPANGSVLYSGKHHRSSLSAGPKRPYDLACDWIVEVFLNLSLFIPKP